MTALKVMAAVCAISAAYLALDHTNPDLLAKFTSTTGKILPRRVTGVPAKVHRKITREIKRARALNLAP